MTIEQIKAELDAKGVSYDDAANKTELQQLLDTANLTNGNQQGSGDAGNPSVAHLFSKGSIRLDNSAFEGVEVGDVVNAPLSSFRRSVDQEWFLGTIKLGGVGTVQVVVGSTKDITMDEMFNMKGRNLELAYTGKRQITRKDGSIVDVPKFAINGF